MKNGFSLLEVMIAVSILGGGIAGAIALTSQTISTGSFASKQFIAAHLAQESLEVVYNIRHTNWVKEAADGITKWFFGLDKPGCTPEPFDNSGCPPGSPIYAIVNYNSTAITQTGANDPSWQVSFNGTRYVHDATLPLYSRHIEIRYAKDGDNKEYMNVKSIVEWDDGSITAEDRLYNWKEAP